MNIYCANQGSVYLDLSKDVFYLHCNVLERGGKLLVTLCNLKHD